MRTPKGSNSLDNRCSPIRKAERHRALATFAALEQTQGFNFAYYSELLPNGYGGPLVSWQGDQCECQWSFDQLLDRAGGDPERALGLVLQDLADRDRS